ncbi:T9SS type B sorting domain-containing protein [Mucilaginibacter kameinonensis]|uniref:T9SS type B sorting domain-containing protein n=1 Tax=Mucilaginibacter kameinonensis TaxID=452286 RepID=UPI000EF75DD4|nr:gliding motility-associated C-terminal domain-containing protein [Mucilaginibacter kameinonensis]
MYRMFSVARITAFLLVSLSFYAPNLFAQAPVIKYTTPHTYKINKPITPLVPANTGGAVPATIYGQVSIKAGRGIFGYFSTVTGVAADKNGNVFFADWNTNKIYKINAAGSLSVIAGSGATGWNDGLGPKATFNQPDALVLDAAGNLYVGDQSNNLIRKITPAGLVTTLAGTPNGVGATNGTGSNATFNGPRGMAVDNAGNVYVADEANNLIRKITPAGVVSTYAGSGASGAENGASNSASFNTPTGVALDTAGNLYVSDSGNNMIRKITPAGAVSTIASGFDFPRELRVDGTGNIYVAEQGRNFIKRVSPSGAVAIVAGTGRSDASGVRNIEFNSPIGLALDGNGNPYVGEGGGDVIKIVLTGYTINHVPLPSGLVFDPKTGIISGKPTVLFPPTVYTITGYNSYGSSTTTITIGVAGSVTPQSSVITFSSPAIVNIDVDDILHPKATSTNAVTPITYTSSNPAVAIVGADGQIKAVAPGTTVITAHQAGNDDYTAAEQVSQTFTVMKNQEITFSTLADKPTCSADFAAGAISSNSTIPLTYVSSNTAVATVLATGIVHIVGAGSATITASQSGNSLYNPATPKSQLLTVTPPVMPLVTISPTGLLGGCDGLEVKYTADAQNAGNNATYQWMVNGQNSGDHSKTFTSSALHTGDIITCVVINNDGCVPLTSPVSNEATIKVDPSATLTLTISSSVSGTITSGAPVTFTAVSPNTLNNPVYQWYVNGQTVGTNSATFTSKTLANGDVVNCNMTSGGKCIANPLVNSNTITVAVIVPEKVIIPNVFTPNGDGHNDNWYIVGLQSNTQCIVNVYNRRGAIIYHSVGYPRPWDGTSNGITVPAGAYYYMIDTKNSSGKLTGEVTVLR